MYRLTQPLAHCEVSLCLKCMAGYTGEPGEGEYKTDTAFQKAKPQIRKFGDLLWQRALKASLQGQQ